jgi:hypothetical protein
MGVRQGLRKGFALLAARIQALQRAIRLDNFRLAQRLRMGLVVYVRHLSEPLRSDVARLFETSGLWVRNVGDRRQTKRHIQQIIRLIIRQLDPPQPLLIAEVTGAAFRPVRRAA